MRSSASLQTESKHQEVSPAVFKKEAGALAKSSEATSYGVLQGGRHSFGKVKVNSSESSPSNPVRIQAKLMINQPGDQYEQEADAMAERVMRMTQQPQLTTPGKSSDPSAIQRKCAACEEEEENKVPVMRKAELNSGIEASAGLESQLYSTKGGGNPLPDGTRSFMEKAFHADFSKVRIHTGRQAADMNRSIQASAFTIGSNIYFNQDQYTPENSEGKQLLVHELTHVLQQEMNPATPVIQRQLITSDLQNEADHLTTEELESEIQAMRSYILEHPERSEGYEQTLERLIVFERVLSQRQSSRVRFRQSVIEAREQQRELPASQAALQAGVSLISQGTHPLVSQSQALFIQGFITGFGTEIPPGELEDYETEMLEHWPEFYGGYLMGLPEGLWNGLTGLVEGIGTLVQIGWSVYRRTSISIQAYEFLSDPQGYMALRRREYEQLRAIVNALQEFGAAVRNDPTIVMQWSSDIGLALGEDLAGRYTRDFLRQSPYNKGNLAGNVVGVVLFEVLLEIILAVATQGIGNLVRGVAAVGQGARAGGRLANLLRRMLEASPAMRRLIHALTGGEDVARLGEMAADATRQGERGVEEAADVAQQGERIVEQSALPSSRSPELYSIPGGGETTLPRREHLSEISTPEPVPSPEPIVSAEPPSTEVGTVTPITAARRPRPSGGRQLRQQSSEVTSLDEARRRAQARSATEPVPPSEPHTSAAPQTTPAEMEEIDVIGDQLPLAAGAEPRGPVASAGGGPRRPRSTASGPSSPSTRSSTTRVSSSTGSGRRRALQTSSRVPEIDDLSPEELRRIEVLQEFTEAQTLGSSQSTSPGRFGQATSGLEQDISEIFGISLNRTPGGRAVPEQFEVGNFSHRYAEDLIPESELPRGLRNEVEIIDVETGTERVIVLGRTDRLDPENYVVYEIKPNTPEQIRLGEEQGRRYADLLNQIENLPTGPRWTHRVVTYDGDAVRRVLRSIGYLP